MKTTSRQSIELGSVEPSASAALAELQAALHNLYGKNIPKLLLYGSYARGQESAASDVDVVLIYSKEVLPGQEIKRLQVILSSLNLRYQILISVLPTSIHQYQTSTSAFWKNVRREAVPIDRL